MEKMIDKIEDKIEDKMHEFDCKIQDYEDTCKRFEHEIWRLKYDNYKQMREIIDEFYKIRENLETMIKELRRIKG